MATFLLSVITVAFAYFQSEFSIYVIKHFGLTYTILISLSFLFISLSITHLRYEPIVEIMIEKIRTKLRKSYQYMFSLTISLIVAGYLNQSIYAYGSAGLILIVGLTFLYFYYCANLMLAHRNSISN